MNDLNTLIDISQKFEAPRQQASIEQDGRAKAEFALGLLQRMPQEPTQPEEPPRIPNLGALAIPS